MLVSNFLTCLVSQKIVSRLGQFLKALLPIVVIELGKTRSWTYLQSRSALSVISVTPCGIE